MKCAFASLRTTIPVWIALACFAIQPPAQADSRPEQRALVASIRVAYDDLDLTKPADAEIFLGRIKRAAFRACGGDPRRHVNYDLMPHRVATVFKACRDDAIARALSDVQTPALAKAHLARPTM